MNTPGMIGAIDGRAPPIEELIMTMTMPTAPDTSILFSLAELNRIETERVCEEETRRARAREEDARARREAAAAQQRAEEARRATLEAAQRQRELEDLEAQTRTLAREQAALEVARIQAEAKARLDADNAARSHELSVLRAQGELGSRRATQVLAGALALALSGSLFAWYSGANRVAALEQEASLLREKQAALLSVRESESSVARSALAVLDQRFAQLCAQPRAKDAEEQRKLVEVARNSLDSQAIAPSRLRAFSEAIDQLEARLSTLESSAILDSRLRDLSAWAAQQKRKEAAEELRVLARTLASRSDNAALRDTSKELDRLRASLAQPIAGLGGQPRPPQEPVSTLRCDRGDPMCGLDGHPL